MKQFGLNKFWVDVARCQIDNGQRSIAVEPRSMDVLAYLAEHPKEVISLERLFESLWPNTIYSPGSVQRCIAQLRKALGDDARKPRYIVTHPKRGVSLDVLPVAIKAQTTGFSSRLFWLVGVFLVTAVLSTWYWIDQSTDTNSASFSGKLTPLSSSSNYDFFPTYSKQHNTLAFIRQTGESNQIIVRDPHTAEDRTILSDNNNYQSLAWADNDTELYFIVRDAQGDWVGRVSLKTGNINRLFTANAPGNIWRVFPSNNALYYMYANVPINSKPATQLKRFDIDTGQHTTLLSSSESFTPYRIALSPNQQTIAIAGENAKNEVEFRDFSLKDAELSKPFATLPLGFTEINWHPNGQSLLVHHLNQLYLIGLDGKQTKLPYHAYQRLFNPTFNPSTGKIVMSLSEYDTDLVSLDMQSNALNKIIDSSGEDHLARYSPDGNSVAFVSSRTGVQQLYLFQHRHESRIFDNPKNLPIYRAPVWSRSGDKIAYSFGHTLFIYRPESKVTITEQMPQHFTAVLDWFSAGDALLIATNKNNHSYFERYDLKTKTTVTIAETGVHYLARLSASDELIYYQNHTLHWGEREYSGSDLPDITRHIIPVENGILFQSGRKIVRFDGSTFTPENLELPPEASTLVDYAAGKMLFYSQAETRANIVLME